MVSTPIILISQISQIQVVDFGGIQVLTISSFCTKYIDEVFIKQRTMDVK